MTAPQLPRLRTLVETREDRPPLIDLAAHDLAHPQPIWGCGWCPQAGLCPLCGKPSPECVDAGGHRRLAVGVEQSWREITPADIRKAQGFEAAA